MTEYGWITNMVVQAHIDHPGWTARDLGYHLGMKPGTIRGIVARARITLPSEHLKRIREAEKYQRKPFRKIGYAGKPRDN